MCINQPHICFNRFKCVSIAHKHHRLMDCFYTQPVVSFTIHHNALEETHKTTAHAKCYSLQCAGVIKTSVRDSH